MWDAEFGALCACACTHYTIDRSRSQHVVQSRGAAGVGVHATRRRTLAKPVPPRRHHPGIPHDPARKASRYGLLTQEVAAPPPPPPSLMMTRKHPPPAAPWAWGQPEGEAPPSPRRPHCRGEGRHPPGLAAERGGGALPPRPRDGDRFPPRRCAATSARPVKVKGGGGGEGGRQRRRAAIGRRTAAHAPLWRPGGGPGLHAPRLRAGGMRPRRHGAAAPPSAPRPGAGGRTRAGRDMRRFSQPVGGVQPHPRSCKGEGRAAPRGQSAACSQRGRASVSASVSTAARGRRANAGGQGQARRGSFGGVQPHVVAQRLREAARAREQGWGQWGRVGASAERKRLHERAAGRAAALLAS